MLEARDRPFFAILVVIAILLGCVTAALSFAEGQQPIHKQTQNYANSSTLAEQPDGVSFWQRTVRDPINLFTGVLAVFTIFLVVASVWQGWLTNHSVMLARNEFATTNRPHIRTISVTSDWQYPQDPAKMSLEARLTFVNAGALPATIKEIRSTLTKDPYHLDLQSREIEKEILVGGEESGAWVSKTISYSKEGHPIRTIFPEKA